MRRLKQFVSHNALPVVSVLAALVTCAFVPPDAAYAGYVDWNTLGRLACVLAVVAALGETGAFQALAAVLAQRTRTARGLVGVLVGVTALASMFVTNDMALLALLPLSYASLAAVGRSDLVVRTFVLQGLAANLCGMLLPFGNPQNIHLVEAYGIAFGPFVGTMFAPFALSTALIAVCCLGAADSSPVCVQGKPPVVPRARTLVLVALLGVCVASVLGIVPVPVAFALVFAGIVLVDRGLLLRTDWGLIVTFAAFFVFSGNLARIDVVANLFAGMLAGGAFVPGALLSQVISNVPAAVVLSRFTADWQGLLVGVNVGGAGTPVGSLATLIVIAQYQALARGRAGEVGDNRTGDGGDSCAADGNRNRGGGLMGPLLAANAAFLVVLLVAGLALGW